MKIVCEKQSRMNLDTQKIESEAFSPESSLTPICNSRQIKHEYNFVFTPNEIQYKSFISYSFDDEEFALFKSAIETMNESIQITIDENCIIDSDCDELLSILKRKPFSTKARTIPGFASVNKPKKMSLVGRVLVNNTQNKNSTLANTQNSTQMNSIVNNSKK